MREKFGQSTVRFSLRVDLGDEPQSFAGSEKIQLRIW